ncbi:MAG TPA: glycosyltransferase [Pseudoxanthomonas sp.]|nr:glycosyltransferase [Pseudoxanthomonas sp.]
MDGLRAEGVEVVECRHDIWSGIADKSQVKGVGRWLGLAVAMLLAYPALLLRYMKLGRHDCVLVCYPAFIDALIIRPFAWLRGTPVLMDWFLCAYDTVVLDRKLISRRNPLSRLLYALEWMSVRVPNAVFMDTRAHAARMERLFGLAAGSCGAVWVGAETAKFVAAPRLLKRADTHVLFYGQFIPLHGIDTIVQAALLLRDEPVRWTIVGSGQEQRRIDALITELHLAKLQRVAWVDYESLVSLIGDADICLGIFGNSEKAASVVPNKVFQILACHRPLITRQSAAMGELVDAADPGVQLVPADDPHALSNAVLTWMQHPPAGMHDYRAVISPSAIGRQFLGFAGPCLT